MSLHVKRTLCKDAFKGDTGSPFCTGRQKEAGHLWDKLPQIRHNLVVKGSTNLHPRIGSNRTEIWRSNTHSSSKTWWRNTLLNHSWRDCLHNPTVQWAVRARAPGSRCWPCVRCVRMISPLWLHFPLTRLSSAVPSCESVCPSLALSDPPSSPQRPVKNAFNRLLNLDEAMNWIIRRQKWHTSLLKGGQIIYCLLVHVQF